MAPDLKEFEVAALNQATDWHVCDRRRTFLYTHNDIEVDLSYVAIFQLKLQVTIRRKLG